MRAGRRSLRSGHEKSEMVGAAKRGVNRPRSGGCDGRRPGHTDGPGESRRWWLRWKPGYPGNPRQFQPRTHWRLWEFRWRRIRPRSRLHGQPSWSTRKLLRWSQTGDFAPETSRRLGLERSRLGAARRPTVVATGCLVRRVPVGLGPSELRLLTRHSEVRKSPVRRAPCDERGQQLTKKLQGIR